MRSATSFWNISVSDSHAGGQSGAVTHFTRSSVPILYGRLATIRGRPIRAAKRGDIHLQGIFCKDVQFAGIVRRNLFQRRDTTVIALNGGDGFCAVHQ